HQDPFHVEISCELGIHSWTCGCGGRVPSTAHSLPRSRCGTGTENGHRGSRPRSAPLKVQVQYSHPIPKPTGNTNVWATSSYANHFRAARCEISQAVKSRNRSYDFSQQGRYSTIVRSISPHG